MYVSVWVWVSPLVYVCNDMGGKEWVGMKGRRGETERGKRSEEKKLRGTKKRVALYGGVLGSGGGRIRPGEIPIVISRNQIGYQTMPDYQAPMPALSN